MRLNILSLLAVTELLQVAELHFLFLTYVLLAYEMEFVDTETDMYGLFPTILVIHGVLNEVVKVHDMAVNLSMGNIKEQIWRANHVAADEK